MPCYFTRSLVDRVRGTGCLVGVTKLTKLLLHLRGQHNKDVAAAGSERCELELSTRI
jgi:hypothetical protein